MLKKILGVLAVVVAGFLAFVAMRPAHYHVERSVSIKAPAEVVYVELEDLHKWAAWSPWEKIDPNMKKSYEGPERGVGASYSWQGNREVGKGKMTIVGAEPPKLVRYKLEFLEPMAGLAEASMRIAKEGDNNFVGKMFGVFMDMDKMIGAQFATGLEKLKGIAESEAQKQRVAAQAPAAEPAQAEAEAKKPSEAETGH
jgi:hypothetical protein